jgi:hypothetical protein
MSNLSQVLPDIVAYFPLYDMETLERGAVCPFVDLDFSSLRRSGCGSGCSSTCRTIPRPVVDSSQLQIFPVDRLNLTEQ